MKGTSEEGRGQGNNVGKLQVTYPQEGTDQYTVYSQTIPQRGPCHRYIVITNEK